MSSNRMHRVFFNIRYFFGQKNFQVRLWLREYKIYLFSVLFAVAGLVASFNDITWLMIVGGIVSCILRAIGFNNDSLFKRGSWDYYYHIPLWTQSIITLLIPTVIGMLLIHFQLDYGFVRSFLFAFNASLVLFYIYWFLHLMVRYIRYMLYEGKLKREIRREKVEE